MAVARRAGGGAAVHAACHVAAGRVGRRAGGPRLCAAARRRLRLALCVDRDADTRHAADPHRTGGGAGVPCAALQHRRRGAALCGRARRGGGGRPARRQWIRRAGRLVVRCDDRRRVHRRRAVAAGACAAEVAPRRRRGGDDAAAQLHRAVAGVGDARRADEGSGRPRLAAERGDCRRIAVAAAAAAQPRAHRPADCAAAGGAARAAAAPHDARLRDPRGRRQRARGRVRRPAGAPRDVAGGAAVRRIRGFGRRGRGGGPRRLRHARHVAGLRLQRHRGGDAGRVEPDRGGVRRRVRRRHAGRRRRHEPRGGGADLHRRRDRRGVADLGAGGDDDDALACPLALTPRMETLDLLFSMPFWAAVLRIATPLIFGTLGVLLCERAGVLNLGIEGIMVAGAFAGWLAVYGGAPLWLGVGVAAAVGAAFGLLHAGLTVGLALSQHVSGLGITLLATALSYYGYRVSFPKVNTPPTVTPFAPMTEWLPLPVLGA